MTRSDRGRVQNTFFSLTQITRIMIIMLIYHMTGCVAGSCISYGHSCWGAHGKRNSESSNVENVRLQSMNMHKGKDQNMLKPFLNTEIFLSQIPNEKEIVYDSFQNDQIENNDDDSRRWKYDQVLRKLNYVNRLVRRVAATSVLPHNDIKNSITNTDQISNNDLRLILSHLNQKPKRKNTYNLESSKLLKLLT